MNTPPLPTACAGRRHNGATWRGATVCALLLASNLAQAQAPGEDPVVLSRPLTVQMLPTGAAPASGGLTPPVDMPAWLRARVARYEAKAYSADTDGILTDNDVVATAQAQGLQKTCVQEVGSNTLSGSSSQFNRYGPNASPQVVVLRGDLVNVCR